MKKRTRPSCRQPSPSEVLVPRPSFEASRLSTADYHGDLILRATQGVQAAVGVPRRSSSGVTDGSSGDTQGTCTTCFRKHARRSSAQCHRTRRPSERRRLPAGRAAAAGG
jgi:hypothetical protein